MPFSRTIFAPSSLNPVSDSIAGGRIPSGNVPINISGWADPLERQDTPFLSRIKMGEAVHGIKNEWGQSFTTPIEGRLGAAATASSDELTLYDENGNAGGGKLVTPWMVLEVAPYLDSAKTRIDTTLKEQLIVRAVSGDVITAIRDNNATAQGLWPTHVNGSYWRIIGVAAPYNRDFVMAPYTRGSRIYNYPQRFMGMVGADIAAQNTSDYEFSGNRYLSDFKNEVKRQKVFLDRALVEGKMLEGNNFDVPVGADLDVIPYKMDGIDSLITKHSGRVTNLLQARLSPWDIEAQMRDQFKDLTNEGAKTILCGVDTSTVFDYLFLPFMGGFGKDVKSMDLGFKSFETKFGKIEFSMLHHMEEGKLLFVDMGDISLHPYKGCSWSTKNVPTAGPYEQKAIWGDYTMKAVKLQRMAKMHNFTVNLDSYGRRAYFQ